MTGFSHSNEKHFDRRIARARRIRDLQAQDIAGRKTECAISRERCHRQFRAGRRAVFFGPPGTESAGPARGLGSFDAGLDCRFDLCAGIRCGREPAGRLESGDLKGIFMVAVYAVILGISGLWVIGRISRGSRSHPLNHPRRGSSALLPDVQSDFYDSSAVSDDTAQEGGSFFTCEVDDYPPMSIAQSLSP